MLYNEPMLDPVPTASTVRLHLTVDDVGTEVKHRFVIKQLN